MLAENGGTVVSKGNGSNDSMGEGRHTETGARTTVFAGNGQGKYNKGVDDGSSLGKSGQIKVTHEYSVQTFQHEDGEGPRNQTRFAY